MLICYIIFVVSLDGQSFYVVRERFHYRDTVLSMREHFPCWNITSQLFLNQYISYLNDCIQERDSGSYCLAIYWGRATNQTTNGSVHSCSQCLYLLDHHLCCAAKTSLRFYSDNQLSSVLLCFSIVYSKSICVVYAVQTC